MSQKVDFITYGDSSKYSISKKHIIGLAKESNFFDKCVPYKFNDLDTQFKKEFQEILISERGGGFYLWKLGLIEKHLSTIKDDDILVYSDSGSSFNYKAKERFKDYVEILNDSNFGNLRFESKKEHVEKKWTSRELFDYFNIDLNSDTANTTQLLGGHLLFKKNEHTFNFLNEFKKVIKYDNKLITDFYSKNQIDEFIENRHDQSIMSLISKLYGGEILENETFFSANSKEQKNYPFLSVRHYGHGLKDKIRYKFGYKKKTPIYF